MSYGAQSLMSPLKNCTSLGRNQIYRLYGTEGHFKSIVYEKTGHEYLPERREEMVAWFEKTLSVKR